MCVCVCVCVLVFQLEKLQALGIRAVLLMARPVRKTNAWQSEILTPRCELTETSSTFLQRMKDVYNIVVKGKNILFIFI